MTGKGEGDVGSIACEARGIDVKLANEVLEEVIKSDAQICVNAMKSHLGHTQER
jgi:hypothetical protein